MIESSPFVVKARVVTPRAYPTFRELLSYWEQRRGRAFAPRRQDVDPFDLPHLLGPMMLADVVTQTPPAFQYRLCGSAIVDVHGADLTGLSPLQLMPPGYGALIHQHYSEALARKAPIAHEVYVEMRTELKLYARLLLPLSEDGSAVTMLWAMDHRLSLAASQDLIALL